MRRGGIVWRLLLAAALLRDCLTTASFDDNDNDPQTTTTLSSLVTEVSAARESLALVQGLLQQLRQQHAVLLGSHAALQDSYEALLTDYNDLQDHVLTLAGPGVNHRRARVNEPFSTSIAGSASDAPSRNESRVSRVRRALSASQVCSEYSNAQLVVEGSGVFTDDLFVGDADDQTSVVAALSASSEAAANLDTLRNWLCRPLDSGCVVKAFQEFSSASAVDVEHFRIDETDFVAVASFRNTTTFSMPSPVYRFSDTTDGFELFQLLETHGAQDWEHFRVGDEHFLAVANFKQGTLFEVQSVVYRYNTTTTQFEMFQPIETQGARDWKHFSIGEMHCLAVANYRSEFTTQTNSVVYYYDNTTSTFQQLQAIASQGAYEWEYFLIENSSYLALANSYTTDGSSAMSELYRYNSTTMQFESFQKIQTIVATGCEYFRIGDDHFLAFANSLDDGSWHVKSAVYRYNTTTAVFETFQEIETSGAQSWEHFRIGASHFLAVANLYDGLSYELNSVVYWYNNATQAFEVAQEVPAAGARQWTHFRVGDVDYVTLAEFVAGADTGAASLMLCNGFCFP